VPCPAHNKAFAADAKSRAAEKWRYTKKSNTIETPLKCIEILLTAQKITIAAI